MLAKYVSETGYDCAGVCLVDTDGDGTCDEFELDGCTDAAACIQQDATEEDGTCNPDFGLNCEGGCAADVDNDDVCDAFEVLGCDDEAACNYEAEPPKTTVLAPMPMPVTIAAARVWPMRTVTVSAIHLKWPVARIQAHAISIRLRPTKTAPVQYSMKLGTVEATAPRTRMAMACAMMWIPV